MTYEIYNDIYFVLLFRLLLCKCQTFATYVSELMPQYQPKHESLQVQHGFTAGYASYDDKQSPTEWSHHTPEYSRSD